jgi:hypothetical protein
VPFRRLLASSSSKSRSKDSKESSKKESSKESNRRSSTRTRIGRQSSRPSRSEGSGGRASSTEAKQRSADFLSRFHSTSTAPRTADTWWTQESFHLPGNQAEVGSLLTAEYSGAERNGSTTSSGGETGGTGGWSKGGTLSREVKIDVGIIPTDKSLPHALQDNQYGETVVRYEGRTEPEVLPSAVSFLPPTRRFAFFASHTTDRPLSPACNQHLYQARLPL